MAGCWRWTSISPSTAARIARCRRWCCRAAPSTPPGRTRVRTCASRGARSRPTCRRTAPSADSARRRAFSRSSATWIALPRPLVSRPTNSACATSFSRETRSPSARKSRSPSTCRRCSITRCVSLTFASAANASHAKIPAVPSRKGSGSPRSCTAPVSRDPAKCIFSRWSRSRRRLPGKSACSPRAPRSARGRTRSFRRSRPRRWALKRTRWRSCSRIRRSCPTVVRPSRRVPAWWSAS